MISEKILIRILNGFSVKDIEYAIRNNIDLYMVIEKNAPDIIAWTRNMNILGIKTDHINYDSVLSYISKIRPDLYSVIIREQNGKSWIINNIESIKRKLF